MTKAIFLDRDGIINVDKTYIYKYEDIEWVEGIFELIRYANDHQFLVIVLTNQSGVARGKYTENDIIKLHRQMSDYLLSRGLRIDDWFYCSDFDEYRRKPGPGMMLEARDKYQIDLSQSFMIGDKPSDILQVPGGGPTTFLLKGNYSLEGVSGETFQSLKTILKRIQELAGAV